MAAGTLNESTVKKIANDLIIPALDRNTAALLTIATQIALFANSSMASPLEPDQVKEKVSRTFNDYVEHPRSGK